MPVGAQAVEPSCKPLPPSLAFYSIIVIGVLCFIWYIALS